MTDFEVVAGELRGASELFGTMKTTADNQLSAMSGVNLTQADFGRIPWLQTRVYDAYVEHTTDCAEVLEDLRDAIDATKEGLSGCADAYESYEESASEAINGFFGECR